MITLLEDGYHQFLASEFHFADPNDSPPNNFLNVNVLSVPTNGPLVLFPSSVVLPPGAVIPVTAINLNQLRYVPNADYSGFDGFYRSVQDDGGIADGGQDTSIGVGLTLAITPVNDAPDLTASDGVIDEDTGAVTIPYWATFNPGGGSDEAAQTAFYLVSNPSNPSLFTQAPAVDSAGNLTFTLADNANGLAAFYIQVQDDGGTTNNGSDLSGTQMFTITVNPVNDAPGITSLVFDSDAPRTNDMLTATVTASDVEGDALTYQYVWSVNGVTVQTTITTATSNSLDLSVAGNGDKGDVVSVVVTPSDASGTGLELADGVIVANSAPELGPVADMYFVEDEEINILLTATDADGDAISFDAFDLPDGLILTDYYNGTAAITGVVQHHGGGNDTQQYPVRITATDNTDTDEVNQFCQATDFNVTGLAINGIPAGNSWAAPVILPPDHSQMSFTFTASGVGARVGGTDWWWTVFERDVPGPDDLMWSEMKATALGAGNNGAWNMVITFYLYLTQPSNQVAGPYENSGETNPDIIKVLAEGYWGGDYMTSTNGIFAAATAPP
ncbi:MAG: hypothetical protein EXS16_12930 [Gemmataceae bacterium]|nr:hypothetical protein [Gemmataceae bacterium]